ncbi:hypothetical protein J4414_02760 [Candidatus Woesearchaeota archaeon]|nr:hypothetical protein [Candidatus Woesearchaeota archaeon]
MQTEQLREDRILANAEKSLEELSDVVLDTEHFDKLIDNINKALNGNYITLEQVQEASEKRNEARLKLRKDFYHKAEMFGKEVNNPDFYEVLRSKILDNLPYLLVIEERGRIPLIDFPAHIKGSLGQRKLREPELDSIYTIGRDLFKQEIAREKYTNPTLQDSFRIFRTIFLTAYKESHPNLYRDQK